MTFLLYIVFQSCTGDGHKKHSFRSRNLSNTHLKSKNHISSKDYSFLFCLK